MKRLASPALILLLLTAASWFLISHSRPGPIANAAQAQPTLANQGASSNTKSSLATSSAPATGPNSTSGAPNKAQALATARNSVPESRTRAWDTNFLAGLNGTTRGDTIRFELLGGEFAEGTVVHMERVGNEVTYVSGRLF